MAFPSRGAELVWFLPSRDVEMVWFRPSREVEIVWLWPSRDVEMVWFWPSRDVEMVWLLPSRDVEMVWFCSSRDVMLVWFWPSRDVKIVWFSSSRYVGIVWWYPLERRKRWYGLGSLERCWFCLILALERRVSPQNWLTPLEVVQRLSRHTNVSRGRKSLERRKKPWPGYIRTSSSMVHSWVSKG